MSGELYKYDWLAKIDYRLQCCDWSTHLSAEVDNRGVRIIKDEHDSIAAINFQGCDVLKTLRSINNQLNYYLIKWLINVISI